MRRQLQNQEHPQSCWISFTRAWRAAIWRPCVGPDLYGRPQDRLCLRTGLKGLKTQTGLAEVMDFIESKGMPQAA
jgi:hypothetical protein